MTVAGDEAGKGLLVWWWHQRAPVAVQVALDKLGGDTVPRCRAALRQHRRDALSQSTPVAEVALVGELERENGFVWIKLLSKRFQIL